MSLLLNPSNTSRRGSFSCRCFYDDVVWYLLCNPTRFVANLWLSEKGHFDLVQTESLKVYVGGIGKLSTRLVDILPVVTIIAQVQTQFTQKDTKDSSFTRTCGPKCR
jgi:hypothetical protein